MRQNHRAGRGQARHGGRRRAGAGVTRRGFLLGAGVAALGGDQEPYVRAGMLRRILPQWRVAPLPVHALTETRLLPARVRALAGHLARRLD